MTDNIESRIVLVSDGHWGYDGTTAGKHDDALDTIDDLHAERDVDIVVHLGDIVHDVESYHQDVIDNFFSELPTNEYYACFGNHDAATNSEWQNYYGHPKDHTFEVGDFGFIIADCGDPNDAGDRTAADADFIKTEIDNFIDQGKEGVFVCVHFPHGDVGSASVGDPEAKEVRDQIKRDEVVACFSGHWHQQNDLIDYEEFDGGRWFMSCRIDGNDSVTSTWATETGNDDPLDSLGIRVLDIEPTQHYTEQVSTESGTQGDTLNSNTIDRETTTVTVTAGNKLVVEADVTNTADGDGDQDIILERDDGTVVDTEESVQLDTDETTSTTLEWITQSGDEGDYTMTVKSDDDSDSIDVSVQS